MASLGRLVSGIAHELNTPAGMIQSAANYNISHSEEMMRLFIEVQKLLQGPEDQFAFLSMIKDLIKHTTGPHRAMSLKAEEKLIGEIKENLKALQIQEADKASRLLAEFGVKEITKFGEFFKKYPQREVLQCLQYIGRQFSHIKVIDIATTNIARLVKALRVYSRHDLAKKEEVDLHQEIEVCLTILKGQIKDGIRIRKEFGVIPKIMCIADELNQVWTNLVLNAIQALNGKGEIVIETSTEDGKVHVKVIDDGPGIPPEISIKIFDPFFTTKPPGEGTGLGLGICEQIVQKHQGQIKVESRPGRTCFEVILPIKETVTR
jgi:signal transduction histidine kinase